MFSSNIGKIFGLQNEYIGRITKNSIKLNKQLTLLIEIQSTLKNQMGGASKQNLLSISALEKAQLFNMLSEILVTQLRKAQDTLVEQLKKLNDLIAKVTNGSQTILKEVIAANETTKDMKNLSSSFEPISSDRFAELERKMATGKYPFSLEGVTNAMNLSKVTTDTEGDDSLLKKIGSNKPNEKTQKARTNTEDDKRKKVQEETPKAMTNKRKKEQSAAQTGGTPFDAFAKFLNRMRDVDFMDFEETTGLLGLLKKKKNKGKIDSIPDELSNIHRILSKSGVTGVAEKNLPGGKYTAENVKNHIKIGGKEPNIVSLEPINKILTRYFGIWDCWNSFAKTDLRFTKWIVQQQKNKTDCSGKNENMYMISGWNITRVKNVLDLIKTVAIKAK